MIFSPPFLNYRLGKLRERSDFRAGATANAIPQESPSSLLNLPSYLIEKSVGYGGGMKRLSLLVHYSQ
jgi:hypothetical protein